MLRVLAVEDNVAEHIDGPLQILLLHHAVEHRVFLVGESVELATHALDVVDNLSGRATVGALEGQVLAEVGQPLLVGSFVAGTSMHGNAAVGHLRRTVQLKKAQS